MTTETQTLTNVFANCSDKELAIIIVDIQRAKNQGNESDRIHPFAGMLHEQLSTLDFSASLDFAHRMLNEEVCNRFAEEHINQSKNENNLEPGWYCMTYPDGNTVAFKVNDITILDGINHRVIFSNGAVFNLSEKEDFDTLYQNIMDL